MIEGLRPSVALIDVGAIAENVRRLGRHVAPAALCAVVKADAYGHGAVLAAQAAIEGGASWLAVALVEEALALRVAGITSPILLLSEFPQGAAAAVVNHELTAAVYSAERIDELSTSVQTSGRSATVHLKVDSGMRRVGASTSEAIALARRIVDAPGLSLGGVFSHLAVSDEPNDNFTSLQSLKFSRCVEQLRTEGINPGIVHLANSGGGIAHPATHLDMVRFGVAIYGNSPDAHLHTRAYDLDLLPVLTLKSEVSHVKTVEAGDSVSYGRIWIASEPRVIATVPIGYADGVPRRLGALEQDVLLGGRRCPIVGRVTMDQIMIDAGPMGTVVNRGDEVVLLGTQGDQRITPWEWATRLDTIAYEITCGISKRIPRVAV